MEDHERNTIITVYGEKTLAAIETAEALKGILAELRMIRMAITKEVSPDGQGSIDGE